MKTKLNLFKRGEVIALTMALLFGCAKTPIEEFTEGDMQTVSINTKAAASPSANILLGEDKIYSAVVYIYEANTDKLVNSSTMYVPPVGSGEVVDNKGVLNRKWRVPPGKKDIYVIANPDAQLSKRLTANLSQGDMETLLVSGVVADFASAVKGIKTKGMIMTGSVKGVDFSPANTTISATVNLTRRHARIHLMLRKAKDLEGITLKVKSVKFLDQVWQTALLAPAYLTVTQEPQTKETTITKQQTVAGVGSKNHTDYDEIALFYSFEAGRVADNKTPSMELVAEMNGVEKRIEVSISETNDITKKKNIQANKIYRVMGTLSKKTLDVATVVWGWTDKGVDGGINGGGDLSVSQSEIFMNHSLLGGYDASIFYASSEKVKVDFGTLPDWIRPMSNPAMKSITLTYSIMSGVDRNIPYVLKLEAGNITKTINVYYRH